MHPLVRGAAAAAVITALGSFDKRPVVAPPVAVSPPAARPLSAPCGARTIPEGAMCLRLPSGDHEPSKRLPTRPREPEIERIPRRPDRPSDPSVFVFPVGAPTDPSPVVLGGFPDIASPGSPYPMGEGIELAAPRGSDVRNVTLEAQDGPSEVVFVGELYGPTLALAHHVREGDRTRSYLTIIGYLGRIASSVAVGTKLEPNAVIGAASDGGATGHIYLEARLVREGALLAGLTPKKLNDAALSVPCDVRNVLPKR
jgi:hypothetical protein